MDISNPKLFLEKSGLIPKIYRDYTYGIAIFLMCETDLDRTTLENYKTEINKGCEYKDYKDIFYRLCILCKHKMEIVTNAENTNNRLNFVTFLKEKGCNVNGENSSPMKVLCKTGEIKIISYLIKQKAYITEETLQIATENKHREIVDYLHNKLLYNDLIAKEREQVYKKYGKYSNKLSLGFIYMNLLKHLKDTGSDINYNSEMAVRFSIDAKSLDNVSNVICLTQIEENINKVLREIKT